MDNYIPYIVGLHLTQVFEGEAYTEDTRDAWLEAKLEEEEEGSWDAGTSYTGNPIEFTIMHTYRINLKK